MYLYKLLMSYCDEVTTTEEVALGSTVEEVVDNVVETAKEHLKAVAPGVSASSDNVVGVAVTGEAIGTISLEERLVPAPANLEAQVNGICQIVEGNLGLAFAQLSLRQLADLFH